MTVHLSDDDAQKIHIIEESLGFNIVLIFEKTHGDLLLILTLRSGWPWREGIAHMPPMALSVFLDGMLAMLSVQRRFHEEVVGFLSENDLQDYDEAMARVNEAERRYGLCEETIDVRAEWDVIRFLSENEGGDEDA